MHRRYLHTGLAVSDEGVKAFEGFEIAVTSCSREVGAKGAPSRYWTSGIAHLANRGRARIGAHKSAKARRVQLTKYRDRRQASSWRCSPTTPPSICAVLPSATSVLTFRGPSMSWVDGSKPGESRTVMTYASPVFAHAAPNRLKKLQTLQNKFCRSAANAHWCVKNSVLHRDLDIPSIAKYMKDASERFFSIAESHSNPLLSAAVSYEAPPPYHFIHRPRNVLTDPSGDFTAEVKRLIEINKQNDD
ncbi:Probable RNA-directed DNA polymerase from transposon X-element [Eumeta japonica]|uniref:Probable RNA-directed DNA polymerase from transposon X-element n=1 Tax=Eumeta variegata TaxID=151549 RepID=A0A4C1VNC0_EUMVA|nr:Probable RNA-directed DNA polymerase from transposon X-element [Eumeta japonica]